MMSVGEAWDSLAKETGHEEGWLVRRLHPSSVCGIFAAMREPGSVVALLIEVGSRALENVVEYPSSRGFEVYAESIKPGQGGRARICLVLADSTYRDVFEVLTNDVIRAVAASPTEDDSVRAFLECLHVWQAFMRKHGAQGLSQESQTGLFGELSLLSECLVPHLSALDSVEAWKGPVGGSQDFDLEGRCVEVKSSTVVPPVSMEISSISQLDESLVDTLVLCHISLAVGDAEGTTLPDIVRQLRELIGEKDRSALDRFNDKLIAAGFLDTQAELYSDTRYTLRNMRFFVVEGGFPRIAAADVPEGILTCSYGVLLAACTPFEIAQSEAEELLFKQDRTNGA